MDGIILAMAVIGGTGLGIGILLGIAGRLLEIKVDEKEVAIRAELPGNNCGGCGYAGCDGLAKAISLGEAPVSACPVGGAATAEAIGKIMGTSAEVVKMAAIIKCNGTCDKAQNKYNYIGNFSCKEAILMSGGAKKCTYGCLGLGTCASVCDYGAISVIDGVAVVDRDICVACGKCVKACPKGLIEIIPHINNEFVKCNTKVSGKEVRSVCTGGCIGCGKCSKECPAEAITMVDKHPVIDYDKCVVCGVCKESCPTKCIN